MAEATNKEIVYFAQTNFRNQMRKFGIKRRDRARHMYIIGKTGTGKTTLIENMTAQDIMNGEGVGIIDPHGEYAEKMLKAVPKERINDVIYFAPHDMDFPISFNVMENVDATQRPFVANGLLSAFKKIWPDVWSARMEYILNNAILALLEYPESTLLGVVRMFSDPDYREKVVNNLTDQTVKAFWTQEFASYNDRYAQEATSAIQNKVGQFISNPLIRDIIGQPRTSFDIREVMDQKKILIMNLSKGKIGEENSRLLGAILITKIYLAAMSRVDTPEEERNDFYLYVDEFQNFSTSAFTNILSESRKYRLNLILAHQYVAQMDEEVQDAVMGNMGTMITFRVGAGDAELFEKEFEPEFTVNDLVNLGFAHIYLKLMIDGFASRPFSATTLPPVSFPKGDNVQSIIQSSRDKYAVPRGTVEAQITEWYKPVGPEKKEESRGDSHARVSRSLPHAGSPQGDKPASYPASCVVCGKRIYVPFEPDGKKPLYCKEHMPAPGDSGQSRRVLPTSLNDGQIVPKSFGERDANQPIRTISLKDLNTKKGKSGESDELKKLLEEIKSGQSKKEPAPKEQIKEVEMAPTPEAKTEETHTAKKGKLKPGQKIKFE